MRCEVEFKFIAQVMGELLNTLPESDDKKVLVANMLACMTRVEMDLLGDTEVHEVWRAEDLAQYFRIPEPVVGMAAQD